MTKEVKLVKLKPSVHQGLMDEAHRQGVAIGDVVEWLFGKWKRLQAFDDIPCKYCGESLVNWRREDIEMAFKDWHHASCKLNKSKKEEVIQEHKRDTGGHLT